MNNLNDILSKPCVEKILIKSKDKNENEKDNTSELNINIQKSRNFSPEISKQVLLMFNSKNKNEFKSPRTFKKEIDKVDL